MPRQKRMQNSIPYVPKLFSLLFSLSHEADVQKQRNQKVAAEQVCFLGVCFSKRPFARKPRLQYFF